MPGFYIKFLIKHKFLILYNERKISKRLINNNDKLSFAWRSSISASRHSKRIVVTSSVNHVSFNKAIPLGSTITIEAKVSRAFNSSMEVYLDVWIDNLKGEKTKANEAIYTFVAVDEKGKPVQIDKIKPESEEEIKRYEGALRRRQLSLVLAGKMKAQEATELKSIFN